MRVWCKWMGDPLSSRICISRPLSSNNIIYGVCNSASRSAISQQCHPRNYMKLTRLLPCAAFTGTLIGSDDLWANVMHFLVLWLRWLTMACILPTKSFSFTLSVLFHSWFSKLHRQKPQSLKGICSALLIRKSKTKILYIPCIFWSYYL